MTTTATKQPPCSLSSIPPELTERPQWVLWQTVTRGGGPTKVPFQPNGTEAKSNDPSTWSTFADASQRFEQGSYDGVGYVISADDDFVGIDLDACRDPETEEITPWGNEVIDRLNSYTEISPSQTGVKIIVRGKSPFSTGKNRKIDGPSYGPKDPGIEIYDQKRYFCLTGYWLEDSPGIESRNIDWLKDRFWPAEPKPVSTQPSRNVSGNQIVDRARAYVQKMDPAVSGQNGHDTTYTVACRLVVGFNLSEDEAWPILVEYNQRCEPPWSEHELQHKLQDALRAEGERGSLLGDSERSRNNGPPPFDGPHEYETEPGPDQSEPVESPKSLSEIVRDHPRLRTPVVMGLFRKGETVNLIAAPKAGKSWLALSLAISVAQGRPWLDTFECLPGRVLIIDGELHPETVAHRAPLVADAMEAEADCLDRIDIWTLRGQSVNLCTLDRRLRQIEPGRYALVILDAWYRFLPQGISENDNAGIMGLYNRLDDYADRLGAAWLNIHHASKGDQSAKGVTDVGSGAGSQSRAADTHLIIRPHETEGVAVLDGVTRSWPPVEPLAIRWQFPVWTLDEFANPSQLKRPLTRQEAKQAADDEAGTITILNELAKNGAGTKRELCERTGTPKDRLQRLLDKLMAQELLLKTMVTVRGNPCPQYRIPPSSGGDVGEVSGWEPATCEDPTATPHRDV